MMMVNKDGRYKYKQVLLSTSYMSAARASPPTISKNQAQSLSLISCNVTGSIQNFVRRVSREAECGSWEEQRWLILWVLLSGSESARYAILNTSPTATTVHVYSLGSTTRPCHQLCR